MVATPVRALMYWMAMIVLHASTAHPAAGQDREALLRTIGVVFRVPLHTEMASRSSKPECMGDCYSTSVPMHVVSSADPGQVLAKAGEHLASDPVLHNLILTLLHERLEQPEPGRYWMVNDGPQVVGVGFQSPLSFPIVLSLMSREAIAALVEAIASAGIDLPGVHAEAATAARFAGQWTQRRKAAACPAERLRIYECREARLPAATRGNLRRALPADRGLVDAWAKGFYAHARD